MKKLLLIIILFLSTLFLLSCGSPTVGEGIEYETSEGYTVVTLNGFKGSATVELKRDNYGDSSIHYSANLGEGALSVTYRESGLLNNIIQPLAELDANDDMPIISFGGYVEGCKILITIDASCATGEVVFAFTEQVLYEALDALHSHATTYEYIKTETDHQKVYPCGCHAQIETEPHNDKDNDHICDVCGYEMTPKSSVGLEMKISVDGTKYAVSGIGSCTDTSIVIPAEHEGLPVVGVFSEAFKDNTKITSVDIPDSVVIIYDSAFMGCTNLTAITLGAGIKGIWDCAFAGCTSLKKINLPDGLEYIYNHAFDGCSSIEEIVVPDSVTLIDPWAFANCTALKSISFSDNITEIKESTCYGCISLTTIDFGNGVTHVRPEAFWGCISLERLYIPANIISLARSFPSCHSLKHVQFEITSGWKWASKHGFFNNHNVTNPETNAYNMIGVWDGSSWIRE